MGRRLLIVLALGGIALLATSASAAARTAYVTIVPAAGPPGTAVTVTGAGFPARRRASVKLGHAGAVKLRVSRTGAFTARLSVPFSALGNLNLVSRTKGRRVLNRFAVATGTGPVSELATSRGQRLRWTVGASSISVQGRGFKKRARLKLRWLGRTLTLRTNRRGRFLAGLALPTSGESHPATVRIGSLRLRFRVVGSFGSGSPTPVGGAGTSPPVGGTSSPPPGSVVPPAPPGPPPPVNTALPVISLGNPPLQGQTAKASTGTWTGTKPISYAYQWQRCDPAGGEGCSSIPGATSSSYKTTATDVGSTMRVVVIASNANGPTAAASNPSAEIQPPPPTTGTVAQWSMESTSSMTDSVGGHTGTTHSVGSDPLGFSGAAYSFNGSSSYVNVPSGTGLNPGNANVTITIHFKTAPGNRPPPEDWDLIRKGLYVDGAEYKMEYYPSGQVGCAFRGSQAYTGEHPAGPTLDDGNWHTIQCIKTGTGYSTVVDGNPVYSANITIGSIANGGDVVIGARPGSEFFHGSLDEASISLG